MTPTQQQTITDALREAGLEDVARWIEHPNAVRLLLSGTPTRRNDVGDRLCVSCESIWSPHTETCAVVAARRTLGLLAETGKLPST